MKLKNISAVLALVALSIIHSQPSTCLAQGSLTPPVGAPAPVMKSLDQIEARTPITNRTSAVTISEPGSYYLTGNLTVSTGNGITINTNGVTLDLNGFTIRSTAASATGSAILLNNPDGRGDITILNGHIRSGVTNNGSGVFGGAGFANGINCSPFPPFNVQVSKVTVSGCLNQGIYLGSGALSIVESCTVATVGGTGIAGSTIKGCVAYGCGGRAIDGYSVSDSRGESVNSNHGINGNTVQNCFGRSKGGDGISSESAMNSHGISISGTGLWALNTATGCRGQSTSGTGLNTSAAMNCSGQSGAGGGLYADVAMNCIGTSSSSVGLSANIANSCKASSYVVTHNVNSF